jgi:hypothetical protein
MPKYKQLNKNAWSTSDQKILYKAGMAKMSLVELCKLIPNRNEKSIKTKLYHMGFKTKNGVIL